MLFVLHFMLILCFVKIRIKVEMNEIRTWKCSLVLPPDLLNPEQKQCAVSLDHDSMFLVS